MIPEKDDQGPCLVQTSSTLDNLEGPWRITVRRACDNPLCPLGLQNRPQESNIIIPPGAPIKKVFKIHEKAGPTVRKGITEKCLKARQ